MRIRDHAGKDGAKLPPASTLIEALRLLGIGLLMAGERHRTASNDQREGEGSSERCQNAITQQ